jgi:DHA1 family tetracycline resistance protein-like MFS transporter
MKRQLIPLYLFVFIDVLGFGLILPLLPYYAQSFGASDTVIGLLVASNALTQLLGAPIIGRLSDRYGRRPLLLLSIAGTIVSFLILGFAQSLTMLFIGRILDGFLGGNISLAQAYIADVTDEKNRAKGLGLIGASFGVGFIFGPALGGALSAGENYARPAFFAAGIAILNLIGVLLWLPESLPAAKREARREDPRTAFTLRALLKALKRQCVGPLLHIRLFYNLAFTMFQTVFSLFAIKRLGLEAQATSFVLAYVGILVAIVQGGIVGALTERFAEKKLALWSLGLMALALLGWAFTPTLWALLIVLIPMALSSGVLGTVTNSLLSKVVHEEEVGGTMGLSSSLGSLARVVSPIVGGFLIDNLGAWAPGVLGFGIMAWLVSYAWRFLAALPDDPDASCAGMLEAEPA